MARPLSHLKVKCCFNAYRIKRETTLITMFKRTFQKVPKRKENISTNKFRNVKGKKENELSFLKNKRMVSKG